MESQKPIGIFDSGIGGLTVAKEIMNLMPWENIVYLGDTARVPYGSKSKETITRFAKEGVSFLMKQDVKMIVIACNTVSATCLEKLQDMLPVPVVGVIEPGARAAVKATKNRKVGVIGTERTVKSGAYERAIRAINENIAIFSRACPLFVPLVEEGWLENEVAYHTAKIYLAPLQKEGIDTLVLGCTHYPLLKPTLKKVMGDKVTLVDSALETAREVAAILFEKGLERGQGLLPHYKFFVSDDPERFIKVGEAFLQRPINPINVVDPEHW
ncbi:glutamate racemase [Caldanaerovirga acetigignens]|uniref:Glutamate racemase n=1 Tax=Caldanaerovirga acetigignens TaxID=447595 RepID=A0A1M7GHS4_9FIRM|nr:glutamate racemase [Caldanaerovirga acetigignens]SHM15761.1 glutamate racemase [Caldanaerovirga acetigignens]